MSELLKKQNYGVEVEFTGISRKMAADAVAEIIGTTASRPDHTCYQTRTIQDSQGRKWKVMRDSSINPIRKVGTENMDEYRVEFVTPVLAVMLELYCKVTKIWDLIQIICTIHWIII